MGGGGLECVEDDRNRYRRFMTTTVRVRLS